MAINTLIQVRRGLAATWTSVNPILNSGEIGFETDTNLFKIGNGSTAWASLAYAGGGVSYAATVTSGGTTTLTSNSNITQNFTGTNTQTIVLPAVSTLQLGWMYEVLNNSTQNITVNSSGGNTVAVLQPGFSGVFKAISNTGTTAASWDYQYSGFDYVTGSGSSVVLATSPTISGLSLTGTLTASSSVGTSGQVLTSTGTGVQWASAASDPTPTVFMLMGA